MTRLLSIITAAFVFAFPAFASDEKTDPLAHFDVLLGDWTVVSSEVTEDGWNEIARTETYFSRSLDDKVIFEVGAYSTGEEFEVRNYFTWDAFRGVYRIALMDGTHGLMDIYEGDFNDEGVFVMDNVRAGTFFPTGDGGEMAFRFQFVLKKDAPEFYVDISTDKGATWGPAFRVQYEPLEEEPEE